MSTPFSVTLQAEDLTKGLRPSAKSPRNNKYLITSIGAVGNEGVISALEQLERIDTTGLVGSFPYPQVFVCTSVILVCDSYRIYELVADSLVLKYTSAYIAYPWVVVDFFEYLYISNGYVVVIRDPFDKTYAISTTLPAAVAACAFNGQVILGSPDVVDIVKLGLWTSIASPVEITMSIIGTMTTEEVDTGLPPSDYDIFIYNFDEGAGHTTYVDAAGISSVTATDNCACTETWKAFGLSSLMVGLLTNAASFFTMTFPTSNWPISDWTLHGHIYISELPVVGPAYYLEIRINSALSAVMLDIYNTGSGSTFTLTGYESDLYTSTTQSLPELDILTDYHLAIVYKNNVLMVFINGIKVMTYNCVSAYAFNYTRTVNLLSATGRFMIDGLEFTSNALWDADFTVPVTAPPNY